MSPRRPADVARLFDAPACRAELLKANVSDWVPATRLL